MNILLTVEELAKYLKIKPDTIYKKARRGELPVIKLGKLLRFPKELIDEWVLDEAKKAMRRTVKETMRDVRAARAKVEARVEEAVTHVRKRAKAASKVINTDVSELIDDVRNAPLNKKQAVITKGLQGLIKDLRTDRAKSSQAAKAKRSTRTTGSAAKSSVKSVKKSSKASSTPTKSANH